MFSINLPPFGTKLWSIIIYGKGCATPEKKSIPKLCVALLLLFHVMYNSAFQQPRTSICKHVQIKPKEIFLSCSLLKSYSSKTVCQTANSYVELVDLKTVKCGSAPFTEIFMTRKLKSWQIQSSDTFHFEFRKFLELVLTDY